MEMIIMQKAKVTTHLTCGRNKIVTEKHILALSHDHAVARALPPI